MCRGCADNVSAVVTNHHPPIDASVDTLYTTVAVGVWPVRPRLYQVVQCLARTLGRHQLPVTEQPVVGRQFVCQQSLLDQNARCMNLSRFRQLRNERADERNAYGLLVEATRVRALFVPAATLIYGSIAAHQKVVANVVPVHRVHVERLDEAHA